MTNTAASRPAKHTTLTELLTWTALAGITIFGALLQAHALDAKSLWLDEGASITIARMDWYNFSRTLWRREMNMVLYYLLLRGWLQLGDSVSFLRSLSVAFATTGIPAIFLLGRKMFGRAVGISAAVLLAVNAYQVRYAQELRSYSLLVLLVILCSYCFVAAYQSGSSRAWNWYVAVSALAIYAHFFAVLVVVSHFVALLFVNRGGIAEAGASSDRTLPEAKRSLRIIFLVTLPIWAFIVTTGAGPISWISRPGFRSVVELFQILSGNASLTLLALYLAGVFTGVAILLWRGQADDQKANGIVLVVWLILPLIIVLLASVIRPLFVPRYLIISMPPLVIAAAVGITRMRPRLIGTALLLAILLLALRGVRSYYMLDFDIGRNDIKDATSYVLQNARPGDAIFFDMLVTRLPYDYYAAHTTGGEKPVIVWPGTEPDITWRDFAGIRPSSTVLQAVTGHQRIWMMTTQIGTSDRKQGALQSAVEQTYRLSDTRDFPFVRVYLFER